MKFRIPAAAEAFLTPSSWTLRFRFAQAQLQRLQELYGHKQLVRPPGVMAKDYCP